MSKIKALFKSYFFFFAFIIILKFTFVRYLLFENANIFKAVFYEFSLILILFALVELLLGRMKLLAYIAVDVILSLLFFAIVLYERYFGIVPTYHDLGQADQAASVSESAWLMIDRIDAWFFADIILLLLLLAARVWIKKPQFPSNIHINRKTMSGVLIVSLLVATFNFWVNKDENILDQTLFSERHGFINGQIVKAYQEATESTNPEKITAGISAKNVIELKGNTYVPFDQHELHGIGKGKNLLIIQLESLQNFVLGLTVNDQEVTPTVNKLAEDSLYFKNVFQQIGAGNTSDAEFMMNTSIYPIGEIPTSKQIEGKTIPSLPRVLNKAGYTTATFHAHEISYWNRENMYPVLGFDEWFALDFYGEEDVVGFGPSDGHFYKKTMEQLEKYQADSSPFYAHLLTLTSHTPFEMPEEKELLDLPAEYKGTLTGNYLQSIRYADHTLGLFIEDLKEKGLWEDTVIALYGDHSGVHGRLVTDKDVKLLHDLVGQPYSLPYRFNIPFIVSVPGEKENTTRTIETIGGQLDMMPTVLNLMGLEPPDLYFGHDLLTYAHNLFGMRYYAATGTFFNDEVLFLPETSKRDRRVYHLNEKSSYDQEAKEKDAFQEDINKLLQIYKWSDAYFNSLDLK